MDLEVFTQMLLLLLCDDGDLFRILLWLLSPLTCCCSSSEGLIRLDFPDSFDLSSVRRLFFPPSRFLVI